MNVVRDFRYALHTLRRSPGYTLMCVGILALGIGANAAIFSVIDSVILRALPYPDPSRLVFVWERFPNLPAPAGDRMWVARRNYVAWQQQNTVFADMAAFRGYPLKEAGVDHPRQVTAGFAAARLLPMLGVQPRLGRWFTPAEESPGADRVAVLSSPYFDRRFHSDPRAIGRAIELGGVSYTVIGVLPPKFHVPATFEGSDQLTAEVWVPLSRLFNSQDDDKNRQLFVAARLKPGVTLARARTEMAALAARLAKADPELDTGFESSVFPFAVEDSDPSLRIALYVLMGAVGFLLLIACANLANLTLARATLRSREVAIRLSLGGTRARIAAQLVTEALVVSAAGAGLGLLLASWSIQAMLALNPEDIQRPEFIQINISVLGFAAAASMLTTLLFGLAPAVAASRANLSTALKSGGMHGASAARLRSRQFLIALEVALALVLVAGAGLMLRSFQQLLATGVGFDTRRMTLADVELPGDNYPDATSRGRFFRALLERARSLPGVSAAAVVDNLPLHSVSFTNFFIAGRPEPPVNALPIADTACVSARYFDAIGLRLEAGQAFTDQDVALGEKGGNMVAAVNRAFVAKFFPGENALGKTLLDGDHKHATEIVAVVSDYRAMGVEGGARPTIFRASPGTGKVTLLVRSAGAAGPPSQSMVTALRNAIWSIDKRLPAAQVLSMEVYVDQSLSQRKFETLLLGIFAGLALVLGMMGVYGVLANLVASRIREIGIRMAIGASPAAIGKLVLRQSLLPVLVGLACGLVASLVLNRFLESLLFHAPARSVDAGARGLHHPADPAGGDLRAVAAGYPRGLHGGPAGRMSAATSRSVRLPIALSVYQSLCPFTNRSAPCGAGSRRCTSSCGRVCAAAARESTRPGARPARG